MKPHILARHLLSAAFALALAHSLLGCVAVNLGPGKPTKSETVHLQTPSDPYVEIKNLAVDRAWKNKNNGNTIAYLSECKTQEDSPLKALETETLSVLENAKVTASGDLEFNDREAIRTSATGMVDGVSVRMETLIFKKNDCTYTLSFVGRSKFTDQDLPRFQNFLDQFRVP